MPENDDEELVYVGFAVENNGTKFIENMHAKHIFENVYELQNSPFYAYGVSYKDKVYADNVDGKLNFRLVAQKSRHSTYRVKLPEGESHEYFEARWEGLKNLGCTYEGSAQSRCRLYSIDIPPKADVNEVYKLLQREEDAGSWTFEEADYSA
jgi:hypothetical protein